MTHTLSIAAGGAIGALLRYWVATAVYGALGREFPYGTLAVNAIGSMLMGLGYVFLIERMTVSVELRAFLLIGLLGAFTTFSTFSIETLTLLENGEAIRAGVNILTSVSLCIVVCWAGMVIGRAV